MPTRYTVDLPGQYYWVLLLDIDNSNGDRGEFVMEHNVTVRTKLSRRNAISSIVRTLKDTNAEFRCKVEAGCSYKVLSISAQAESGFSQHASLCSELSFQEEESFEMERTESRLERVTVRPGERLTLYQLQFEGPGAIATFQTKATHPQPIPAVTIRCLIEVADDSTAPAAVPAGSQAIPGPIMAGTYAIRSCHGTYFRGHPGGEGSRLDLQTAVGPWEKWVFVHIRDNVYGIKSSHGTYIRAFPGGEGAPVDLQVDKRNWKAMPWEQFEVIPATNGRFGLRSTHGTYIRAHPGDEGATLDLQVDKRDWAVMPWEQFELVLLS